MLTAVQRDCGTIMNRSRLFFHVGLHKTGTTWLQDTLLPNLPNVSVARTRNLEKIRQRIIESHSSILVVSHEGMTGSISLHKTRNSRLLRTSETICNLRQFDICGIIIGFREQNSWINSAYYEKAKARSVCAAKYLSTFAVEELLWCNVLGLLDSKGSRVFAFLYDELVHRPSDLVADLCDFLTIQPPSGLEKLFDKRVNPSPRSARGQRVSRLFLDLSDKAVSWPTLKRGLRRWGAHLGTLVDSRTQEPRAIQFPSGLDELLRCDWNNLVGLVSERRGRDFSPFKTTGTMPP